MINTIFLNPEGSLQPTSIPRCELYPLILAILAWPNSILAHSASSLGLILYDTHLHVYTFDRNKETSELNVSFIAKIKQYFHNSDFGIINVFINSDFLNGIQSKSVK